MLWNFVGAVREHGYIPWDDDLDMGLVGEDYVKFIDTIANDYSNRYQIFNPYTRAWYKMYFSHIANSREVSFDREHLEEWCVCPFMTGLDVYPYYYIPRNKDDEEFILSILKKIDSTIALLKQSESIETDNSRTDIKKSLEEATAIKLVELQHLTGCSFSSDRPLDNQLEILYDQVCRIPEEQGSDYVTRYDEYAKDRNRKFPKEYFKHSVYIPFEYTKMPCPIGYDDILNKRFGGEFIVPRQEKGAHDYPYYRKHVTDYYDVLTGCFSEYYGDKGLLAEKFRNAGKKVVLCEHTNQSIDGHAAGMVISADNHYYPLSWQSIIEKEDGKRKKVILYVTDSSILYQSRDKILKKIRDSLDVFRADADDIALIWRPYIPNENEEEVFGKDFLSSMNEMIEVYRAAGWGILDTSADPEPAINAADAVYGDSDYIVARCMEKGVPAMIQNPDIITEI